VKFIKYIGITFVSLLVIFIVLVLLIAYEEELSLFRAKLSWEQPTSLRGVAPGDSRSDIYFRLGSPTDGGARVSGWGGGSADVVVEFEGDTAVAVYMLADYGLPIPFRTVEEMHYILGSHDILASNADMTQRQYTYTKPGASYIFSSGKLEGVIIGDVVWRVPPGGVTDYVVKGKVVCPSEDCPFDATTGDLLPAYGDKSYRDFID